MYANFDVGKEVRPLVPRVILSWARETLTLRFVNFNLIIISDSLKTITKSIASKWSYHTFHLEIPEESLKEDAYIFYNK